MTHRLRNRLFILVGMLLPWVSVRAVAADTLPWISTRGGQLVDASGRATTLRGVSLGGWLVEETWMMPIVTDPPAGSDLHRVIDHHTLWTTIEKRLGRDAMIRMRSALRNAWITEDDFARMHAAGFNAVRLPFLYDLLEEPGGFTWLDRAITWGGRHHVYIILDLHGAPGGQSKDQHTGWADENQFFHNEDDVRRTCAIWRRVAARYRDDPRIAAYDLLNEPMGTPDVKTLYRVQNELYKAIREVDTRHVIAIEDGYTGLNHMPVPAQIGWKNVMLSCHHYQFHAHSLDDQLKAARGHVDYMARNQKTLGVPLYLGEFNQEPYGSPKSLGEFVHALDAHGWPWSLWTWKLIQARGTQTMWGVYRNPEPVEPLNPFTDAEKQFIEKTHQFTTDHLTEYPGLIDALRPVPHP